MATNPCVTRHKEYHVLTLVRLFYFSCALASSVVAKLEIVVAE
jgi:hypothetical protein